jgi:plasmid stabilization system protein ParE
MYEVIVLRRAATSLAKARRWYYRRTPRAASDFLLCVEETLAKLARDPLVSQRWDDDYRYRRVPRFPYVVFFRIWGQKVFVVAIVHERRKPGRWKRG